MNKIYRFILFAAILSIVANFLSFTAAIHFSPSTAVRFPGHIDPRVKGVNYYGWTQQVFSFQDSIVLPSSAKVGFAFDTARPVEAGAAMMETFINGVSQGKGLVTREPFYLESLKDASSIDIRFEIENPFVSKEENESNELKGARLTRVKLEPKDNFLLPNISQFYLTFIFSVLFSVSLFLWLSTSKINLKLLAIAVPLAGAMFVLFSFSNIKFYGWERAWWFFAPVTLIFIGASIGSFLRNNFIPERNEYGNKLFFRISLLLILAFGLWIRISGVSFGLPLIYHPDESRKINIARGMVISGNLDPDYFRHPTFLLYSTAAISKIHHLYTGEIPGTDHVAKYGRSVSAILGALTIWILYLIGKIAYGRTAGLIAAALLAVNPLHIVCSRYIKEDVSMMFFSLTALLLVLRFIFSRTKLYYLPLAGLIVGFASSVKYTGVLSGAFLIVPMLCIILSVLSSYLPGFLKFKDLKLIERNMPTGLMVFILTIVAIMLIPVGFLLITPYSIINSTRFITDFTSESRHMKIGHGGVISAIQYIWSFHIEYSYIKTLGLPLFLIGLFSLGLFVSHGTVAGLIPFAGVILFYLPAEWVNAKPFPQPERYILPTIPFLILGIGHFFQKTFTASGLSKLVSIVVLFVTMLIPFRYSLFHYGHIFYDTRAEATTWVRENIPEKSRILSDWFFYGPVLDPQIYEVTELKTPAAAEVIKSINVKNLLSTGKDYFITSSFYYNRFLYQIPGGHQTGLGYQEVFSTLKPIAEFKRPGAEYGFHNPTIRIYDLKNPQFISNDTGNDDIK